MSTPTPFGAATTADEVLAGRDLRGTRVLVTGASGGLGLEAARALAAHGAAVTLAARDTAKLERAASDVAANTGNTDVDWLQVDLASLASVREAVRTYAARHDRLNVLVNNAGVMASPLAYSADGHEMQFAVCHLGHFLLTCLLVPLLERARELRAGGATYTYYVTENLGKITALHYSQAKYKVVVTVSKNAAGKWGSAVTSVTKVLDDNGKTVPESQSVSTQPVAFTNHYIAVSALPLTGGMTDRQWLFVGGAVGGLAVLLIGAAGVWNGKKRLV